MNGADELARDQVGTSLHSTRSIDGQPDRDGRVQVRDPAGHREACEHADEHTHGPCPGDDDPPGVLSLRLVEQHAGDHAVADQNQERRADHLSKEHLGDHPLLFRAPGDRGQLSGDSQKRSANEVNSAIGPNAS